MWFTKCLRKHPGAALCKDFANARLITLSRPDALNTMTVAMLRDLYKIYVTEPHTRPDAVYVLRGEGNKAFCAGGDILALGDLTGNVAYRDEYYAREYEIDLLIATMPRPQVALWRGHVLGSGVGISLHGRYRVACETTRFAMPETRIGALPDVASLFKFGRMRMPALGAYLAITGEALRGADVFHAGLATHYASSDSFATLEEELLQSNGPAEVARILEQVPSKSRTSLPPFTLSSNMPLIESAFTLTATTTVQDIMRVLQKDGSPFALATLMTMEHNSPTGMVAALESFRMQRDLLGPQDIAKAMLNDLRVVNDADCYMRDFFIGPTVLLKDKSKARPPWNPATVDEIDVGRISKGLRHVLTAQKDANADSLKGHGDHAL